MWRVIFYLAVCLVIVHGIIHLMGFVAYWPLGQIAELPYKTTLLGTRWDVGPVGMRIFSLFWLISAIAMVGAGLSLVTRQAWWLPVMLTAVFLSLVVTALDWQNAFRGSLISLFMLLPLLVIVGLRVQPPAFGPYPGAAPQPQTLPLPNDLPVPVARYYQTIVGEKIPLIETAVISARGTTRFMGVTFPARLRFTHQAGQGYRHYIETTIFGFPLLKVNERFLDGQAWMALPIGVVENEPKVDMAANLGLWGESIWLPSVFLTDPRVHWEAVDEFTARLVVPSGEVEDSFMVYFDPATGLIERMEALRYREPNDEEKILWQLKPERWGAFNGVLIPSRSTAAWADEGSPWLVVEIDAVAYNAPVADYIRATGP